MRPDVHGTTGHRVAIFVVKLVHSLVFLSVAAGVVHIFYAGVTGRSSKWTKRALILASAEGAIFAGYRFRCPLRTLAEALGAESGQVTDIFLPRWLADRIHLMLAPLLMIGIGGLLRQHRNRPR